jgi:hypothetical protein
MEPSVDLQGANGFAFPIREQQPNYVALSTRRGAFEGDTTAAFASAMA